MDVLKNSSHNGYPVVDDAGRDQSTFSVGYANGIPTERIPIGVLSVGKYSGRPHHHHCCFQSGSLCFFFYIFNTRTSRLTILDPFGPFLGDPQS